MVSQGGGVLLTVTARVVRLDSAVSAALRRPSMHDAGKVVLDLKVTLALGGTVSRWRALQPINTARLAA
jgi:hypothetical protein